MAAWSQVPRDVWGFIGDKLQVRDRIRFRSVCKAWRSLLPFPQPPWLMLAEDENTPNTRGFFGLGQRKQEEEEESCFSVGQLELPEVYRTKTLGSTGTWLVTLDLKFRIRMLNILSRVHIDLPPLTTLDLPSLWSSVRPEFRAPGFIRNYFLEKVVLNSSSSSGGRDCIAMCQYKTYRQAYARPGDTSWTPVKTTPSNRNNGVLDIICYKGRFYGITAWGTLLAYTLADPATTTQISSKSHSIHAYGSDKRYLVEWAGELLSVIRFVVYEADGVTGKLKCHRVKRFEVYKFDFAKTKWTPLKDLGRYCLFLGLNTSAAVFVSSKSGLRKNSIYFTDDFSYAVDSIPMGLDMGVYDLEDNTTRPHYTGTASTSSYSPPLWIVPKSMLI